MRFENPVFLYLLILVPVLIFFFIYSWKKKQRRLETFGKLDLIRKLSGSVNVEKQKIKTALLVLAFFLLVLAVSGPQLGSKMVEVKRRGVDVIIAVDCSLSMQAQDFKPTRLIKAKRELTSLISRLNGDRVGIIAFAGTAFLQCPLTLDYGAARMFLDIIDVNLIPYPGTNISSAIELAIKSFSQKERKYKALVLLTDGEDHKGNLMPAVDEALKEGIRIYTVGIGSPEGEPIPVYDENGNITGYKNDKKGAVVLSKLDEKTLMEIALKTGGKYYKATPGEFEIEGIYDDISKMDKKALQSRIASQYEDRYQIFIFLVLALLTAEYFMTETRKEIER